jgi:AraC-like DNA-binding protein
MIMRRLETVKFYLAQGESIVNAALNAGFFDQSHMTRHFIKTFGLTPTQWKMINIKR